MKLAIQSLSALGGSLILSAAVSAEPRLVPVAATSPGRLVPVAAPSPARLAPVAAPPAAAPVESAQDKNIQPLLERLSTLGQLIARENQSQQSWRLHVEQAEVLLQLAAQAKAKDRDDWLRMAVDSHYGAAVISPAAERTAYQRLVQLPAQLARAYPGNPIVTYAALKEIQADHMMTLEKNGGDAAKAKVRLCNRMLGFAREYPTAPEAPKAVLDAGQTFESLQRIEDASRCYRYLAEHFSTTPQARKAEGSLWRLGGSEGAVNVELPLLFASGESASPPFNLKEYRGKLVVVYFWSSENPQTGIDFDALKRITDRHLGHGLEMVYVNVDVDPAKGREFLSGRLTAGIHLYQKGGLDGIVANRYGIQAVPTVFLVAKDGTLAKHSLQAAQLETEISGSLPRDR